MLNKPRVAPHLIGTFTDNASVQPLKADGSFEFPPLLSDKDARSFKDETVWIYRLDGRVVERREARSVHQDKSFVVNEWLFDIARVSLSPCVHLSTTLTEHSFFAEPPNQSTPV